MEIELFGQLAEGREAIWKEEFLQPLTVHELAEKLSLDIEVVGLISIDGKQSDWNDQVTNVNRICFFPYLEGG
jgi:hypothetical protein